VYGSKIQGQIDSMMESGQKLGLGFVRTELGWPNMYQVATRDISTESVAMTFPRIKAVVVEEDRVGWLRFFEENWGAGIQQKPSNLGELHPEQIGYAREYLMVPFELEDRSILIEMLVTTRIADVPVEAQYQKGWSEEEKEWARKKAELIKWRYYQEFRRRGRVVDRFIGEAGESDRVLIYDLSGRPWHLEPGSRGLDFAYSIHSEIGADAIGLRVTLVGGETIETDLNFEFVGGEKVEVIRSSEKKVNVDDFDVAKLQKTREQIRYLLNKQREDFDEKWERIENALGSLKERLPEEINELELEIARYDEMFIQRGIRLVRWAFKQAFGEKLSDDRLQGMIEEGQVLLSDLIKFGGMPKAVPDDAELTAELKRSRLVGELMRYVENLR